MWSNRYMPLALFWLCPACGDALSSGGLDQAELGINPAQALNVAPPPGSLRIAFGSCYDNDEPEPLWGQITRAQPDAWLWLGDNIYADTTDPELIRSLYNEVLRDPGYERLSSNTLVLGTWDDHDYGANDAGKEFSAKEASQKELLDFLGEPEDSPRREQAGVYAAQDLRWGDESVRVILLDTRYHRDAFGSDGTVLGQEQWRWLEQQLDDSSAVVNIIASSIQLIPEENPNEQWSRFPSDKQRLLELFANTSARNLIVVSGDRHIAEISELDLGPWTKDDAEPRTLYEITSSSMSRPSKGPTFSEPNRYRVGELFSGINFGTLTLVKESSGDLVQFSVRDDLGFTRVDLELALAE